MKSNRNYKLILVSALVCAFAVAGCSDKTTTIIQPAATATTANPINPKVLVQFENPFIEIPIAPTTVANTYTATVRQSPDWDFGLRYKDPYTGLSTTFKDPATGNPIKTKTWYYDVNGAPLGIYAATIETTSGSPVTVTYVNDLRDEPQLGANGFPTATPSGTRLTKSLIPVDPTIDGMNLGEPEVRTVVHLHGAHVDWRYDGHPEAWITNIPAAEQTTTTYGMAADASRGFPGRPSDNKVTYSYVNDQLASTLWFHDHSYGITRLGAYEGMAGFYLIRDSFENGLGLPRGPLAANPVVPSLQSYKYDLPVVLQDKSFSDDGALVFPTFTNLGAFTFNALRDKNGNLTPSIRPEMFGTVNVVNGKAWPTKTVEKTAYRFRIVNGADSRVYNLWLQDAKTGEIITPALATAADATRTWPVVQIGAEQGLFTTAVPVMTNWRDNGLTVASGQRADIVIDFSHPVFSGRTIILRNDAPAPFGGYFGPAYEDMTTIDPTTTGKVMQFVVGSTAGASYDAKIKTWTADNGLRPYEAGENLSSVTPDKTRYIDLQERKDLAYAFVDPLSSAVVYRTQLLINGLRFHDPITEVVAKNNVEDWVIINTTPDMHPMHLHLVKFQVIEKGHILVGGTNPSYVRADGAGALPQAIPGYAAYAPNTDPFSNVVLMPDTTSNNLYTRSNNETGWRDTVMVPPAMAPYDPNGAVEVINPGYVRIRARFDLPAGADSPATYMYHCHILSHEEHEMMRPFTVQ